MQTLWTRGPNFPLSRLESRLIPTAFRSDLVGNSPLDVELIPWRGKDSCHGDSGDGEGGLFGRRAAASCDGLQARQPEVRRLLSLAAVLDGMSRADAARIGGMDRQTLRDWVHRFNERGPEGLKDSWSKGHPPRLSAEQLAQLAEVVETGPERAVHEIVRWRRVDLQQIVAERFGVAYHERTIGKILKQLRLLARQRASPPSGQGRGDRGGF